MRFTDDGDLSFCLTVSTGIKRDELLAVLGAVEPLPLPQTFDDFAYETHQPGKRGLLNVFEVGDHLVTVENNGFLGVAFRTLKAISRLYGPVHYVVLYQTSSSAAGFQYAEVQNGEILANFDPQFDDVPDFLSGFFLRGWDTRHEMIRAAESRTGIRVQSSWLEEKTDTYVIDYCTSLD